MSFNGSGVFDPPAAPDYPAVSGDVIYASRFNAVMQDIFDGLSQCITKDGQQTLTGPINFSNQELYNVSRIIQGTETDDGVNALQITGTSRFTGIAKTVAGLSIGPVDSVAGTLTPQTNNSIILEADPGSLGTGSAYLNLNVRDNTIISLQDSSMTVNQPAVFDGSANFAGIVRAIVGTTIGTTSVPAGSILPVALTKSLEINADPDDAAVNSKIILSVDSEVVVNVTNTLVSVEKDLYVDGESIFGDSATFESGLTTVALSFNESSVEGTFTPTITGSDVAGSAGGVTTYGSFTRTSRTINFRLFISWGTHTGEGRIIIGGLPHASANIANNYAPVIIYADGIEISGTGYTIQGYINPNSSSIDIWNAPFNGDATLPVLIEDNTSGQFMISGSYATT